MPWTKTPVENDELFRATLPRDPRISLTKMFGCLVALVHGRMYAATFSRSVFIRLAPAELAEALRLDGAAMFAPGNRGGIREMVLFPESIMDERDELRTWLQRGLAYSLTVPPKPKPPMKMPRLEKAPPRPQSRPRRNRSRDDSVTGKSG